MSGYHFVVVQQAGAAAPAPPAPGQPPSAESPREALRTQIRNTIQDVETSVQDASAHQQQIREAEQRVDAARRQTAAASTPRERGEAGRELGLATADLALLRAQGSRDVGMFTMQSHPAPADFIPPQAVDIAYGFFIMLAVIIIGWPLARAFGRRLERRGGGTASMDPAAAGQLQRIEQAVEAMSIEIERISESQRFMAKLQGGAGDRSAIGGGERH